MHFLSDLSNKERMILELKEVKAIDFGQFKLKSGIMSPYYMDLRLLVSYPHLLQVIADVMWDRLKLISFDLIVGVPYAALPITTAISLRHNRPIIYARKERKEHGKGKLIEGVFHKGQHVVVIDDVITDGASKIEVIKPLEDEGLIVSDVIVLVDRGQGGPARLKEQGYHCHTITNMSEILDVLYKHRVITREQLSASWQFMGQSAKTIVEAAVMKKGKQNYKAATA